VFVNAASKLMQINKSIVIKVADDIEADWGEITYNILWGALQLGETIESEKNVYVFGALPVTILQTVGNRMTFKNDDAYSQNNIGKDFYPTLASEDWLVDVVEIYKDTTTPTTETLLEVGDVDSDGIKTFYVLKEGDVGYDENVHKVLQFKAFTSEMWHNNLTDFTAGTSQLLGYGLANTQLIVDNLTDPEYSQAYKLLNKAFGGYSDWYMPSANELAEILKNAGYLDPTMFYYSSSDYSASQANAVYGYPESVSITAIDKDSSQPMIGVRTNSQPLFTTTEELVKTYIVKQLEYCPNGVYLRWIYKGEYQYFYFQIGDSADELEDGAVFKNNVWGLEPTNNVFASDIRLKDKTGKQIIECGVKTAPYEQQLHLIGLQRSIKQWMYENGNWIEVKVEMTPIVIDRLHLNKEINVRVIKPSLYMESL